MSTRHIETSVEKWRKNVEKKVEEEEEA